jgi:hypothetical protein
MKNNELEKAAATALPFPYPTGEPSLAAYPLLDALRSRRSRRFGLGMKIASGPFAYESHHPALPLDEAEEAALAFAACGITGPALADLAYGAGQGGSMLAGLVGRTVGSPDAINTVSLVITNDEVTYLLKRPQDFTGSEISALIKLAEQVHLRTGRQLLPAHQRADRYLH